MIFFCTIAVFASALLVIINLLASALLLRGKDLPAPEPGEWPAVAVLLAVRNEEQRLEACLRALARLDYPAGKLQLWIGNDASTDRSRDIAEAFCKERAGWALCNIVENQGLARGKANVLAQLADKAAPFASYYFMTDADVAVEPGWIKELLRHVSPGVGIVSGTTVVAEQGWWARQQRFDWALGMGLVKAYTYLPQIGKSLSAIGNNMLVSRAAYESVGGYAQIPFSVTEDYQLHRELERKGYSSRHIARPEVKAHTTAVAGWGPLLHQRKRWMRGAMQLPFPLVALLFVQALFLPAILLLFYWSPFCALCLLLGKLLSQALLIRTLLHRLQEPAGFPFLGFEFYSLSLGLTLVLFYFLPLPLKWKGRRY